MFNNDGTPNQDGAKFINPVKSSIEKLTKTEEFKTLTEAQKLILKSWLSKMVGDLISRTN